MDQPPQGLRRDVLRNKTEYKLTEDLKLCGRIPV